MTDKLPSMVSYWGSDGRCQFANPAYIHWIGRTQKELIGKRLDEVLDARSYERIKPRVDASHRGEAQYYETKLKTADGADVYCQVHYLPDIKHGVVQGVFVLITDVSAIKNAGLKLQEANQQLASALKEAKAANEAKGQFLSNMSHEIRTPMNSVLGFLGLALENELTPGLRRQLTTAHKAAKSLLVLINDILDLSKLQSGKIEFERLPFNLHSLIDSAVEMLAVKAIEKKLDIRVDYAADAGLCFVGDPIRIRQVVTNLLGNAIKFTDVGQISISVGAAEGYPGVVIKVADTGIGMTPEQMQRIFSPFVQADNSTTRRFGGTGLGVSICKQIVEAMGGSIGVESVIDKGSTFFVSMPLEPLPDDAECSGADDVENETARSQRRFRVLLADDIEENIELGLARLKGQGHAVDIARSGLQAVQLSAANDYDIILMDVHMPEMNGLDATREIRRVQREAKYQVPIVALTASVMASERAICMQAGMTGFIGKPIDFHELLAIMEKQVPTGRGHRNFVLPPAHDAVELPPSAGRADIAIVDLDEGCNRWGGTALYMNALSRFSSKYGDAPSEMRALVLQQDWDAAYQLSHAFKGIASTLSLVEAAAIAAEVDGLIKARKSQEALARIGVLENASARAAAQIAEITLHMETESGIESAEAAVLPIAVDAKILDSLSGTLNRDDPDAVEQALTQHAGVLPENMILRLRRCLEDYEFDQARGVIEEFRQASAVADKQEREVVP